MPVEQTTDADEVTWRVIIKTFALIKTTTSDGSTNSLNTVRNAVRVIGNPKGSKVEVSFVGRSTAGDGTRTNTYDVKVSESKKRSLDQFEGTLTLNLGPIEDSEGRQSASTNVSPPATNENVYILSNPGGVTRVTNLRVVPTLNSGLRVTAEPARDAKGGYRVNWRVQSKGSSFLGPANIDKFPYEITNLTPGMTYIVRVSTLDADGNEVPKTNVNGSGTVTSAMVDSSLLRGTVTEDADPNTVSKTLAITGADGATFTEQAGVSGTYGSFSITSAGIWTYTLDNDDEDTDGLAGGAEATDAFTIMLADGTSGTVTITITGDNDAATIGGATTGSITEDTATTTGTVTSTDVDGTDNTFKTEVSPATGTYGSLTITTAGVWTYTLDNSAGGATDLLNGTEDPKKTDVFTIMAADGASGTITITITGVNDPATIGGVMTGAITEGTATTTGTVTSTDPDGDNNVFKTEVSPTTGTYGSLTITTAGVCGPIRWTIVLAVPLTC